MSFVKTSILLCLLFVLFFLFLNETQWTNDTDWFSDVVCVEYGVFLFEYIEWLISIKEDGKEDENNMTTFKYN